MAKSYRPYFPDQDFLLPPSLREWLPENHLVYFVSDVIDNLTDIGALCGTAMEKSSLGYIGLAVSSDAIVTVKPETFSILRQDRLGRIR
jgi:hypothetical protein